MTRFSCVVRALRRVLAAGALTALGGLSALHAQEQTAPTGEQEQQLQTVVVTGSIIKRTDFETPSPVQVVTASDLQQSGYTSVSDVLRNLSANGQGTLSQSFGLAFAGGGSGVALRGLTVGGTLTMIDGQRMIPYPLSDDGQRSFVDITQIPFPVIDRIDVLKDGASAEYGSDAIAGVVNVVLKKAYTGLSISAEAGTTSKHDGTTEHITAIGGIGDLGSDGYNAYLAFEYRHQDPIMLANRSGLWTNQNWAPFGGADTRWGSYNPVNIPTPAILGGYVLNPATNVVDSTTHFLDPGACANYAAYKANQCVYQPGWQIQPQTGNVNLLGRFTKNLSGDWQAIVTGSLFRSEAEQVGFNNLPYPFLNGLNPLSSVAYGPGMNPTTVTTPPILLPKGAPNNPFNAPAALVADFPQLGMVQTQFVTNTYRLFGDLKGTAAGWDIDAAGGVMYSALEQDTYGLINPSELLAAANNDFNFATASGAQMAQAFAPEVRTKDTNTMQVVNVNGTHELAQLSGGALSLAIGTGYFHLYKNSPAASQVSSAAQPFGNGAYAIGGQTNYNAYLELVAPLLKGLEVDLAGRYDHYNLYGGSTTPKFGLKYTPVQWLTLRGTYGKGFRAPNPAEAGEAAALFGGLAFNDAALCPTPGDPTAKGNFPSQCNRGVIGLQVSNPALQPEKSSNYTFGFILQPLDNTSISFDYWDIKVNQDIQSGTSVFVLSGFNLNLFPVFRGAPVQLPFCTANGACTTLTTTPVGPVAYQPFPYFNATQTHVNGLDVDLLSKFDIGKAGRLTAQFNGSYMFHYDFGLQGTSFDLAGTHGPSIISGDTGNPKIRAVASLAWDIGSWNVTASVNYVGRFNLTDPTAGLPTCETAIAGGGLLGPFNNRWPSGVPQSVLNSYCEVQSFTDVDLYAQYAFTKNFAVHGSILNVFGQSPPLDLTTYGASGNAPYNPAMHQAGAVGRFFNVGATFTW